MINNFEHSYMPDALLGDGLCDLNYSEKEHAG